VKERKNVMKTLQTTVPMSWLSSQALDETAGHRSFNGRDNVDSIVAGEADAEYVCVLVVCDDNKHKMLLVETTRIK